MMYGCNRGRGRCGCGCAQGTRCPQQDPCEQALNNIKQDVAGLEDQIGKMENYLCSLKRNLALAEQNCDFCEPAPCPRPCPRPCPCPCPCPDLRPQPRVAPTTRRRGCGCGC